MPDVGQQKAGSDPARLDELQPGAIARGIGLPVEAQVLAVEEAESPAVDRAIVEPTALREAVQRETRHRRHVSGPSSVQRPLVPGLGAHQRTAHSGDPGPRPTRPVRVIQGSRIVGRFASANQQDRHRAVVQDVLGIASHDEAADAAPAVRPAHDQLRGPGARFAHDVRPGPIAGRLDEPTVDLDRKSVV